MKSNALLKWLVVPILFIVIFIVVKAVTGNKETDNNTDIAPRLTAEEMKALGIEGDTPRDTLATLVGQVKQLRQELQDARLSYQDQKVENERLRARESNIDQKINSAFNSEKERLRQEQQLNAQEQQKTSKLLGELQTRIGSLGNKSSSIDLPIGLGLEQAQTIPDTVIWVEPSDVKPIQNPRNQNAGNPFATSFNGSTLDDKSLFAGKKIKHENYAEKADSLTPVYTIPVGSTLMGSVAMTALIGRVPVDGTVNDPYPFKVLVGPDNLTANGIDLPDVVGAVLSGSASGDWTLSCVRGQVTSMTFVFSDGTIRTVPKPGTGESTQNNNRNATSGGLGWISDPYGIPCVSGERKSNAAEYISNQSLITAAGAGVGYLLRDTDNKNYSNGGDVTTGTDAVGQILQGGVKDISTWMNKLYGEAFAAVYVKPGAKVAVHLDQELAIDFDEQGRRVDYKNNGGAHALSLD